MGMVRLTTMVSVYWNDHIYADGTIIDIFYFNRVRANPDDP